VTVKIALVANTAWYLANFRLNLAHALQEAGYEVIAIAPPGTDSARIEAAGIRFIPLPMDNKGTNPARDLALFHRLVRLLRQERPAVLLGYTIKPNVYGGLACRMLRIPSIHNISGLGTVFIRDTWITRLVKTLYRQGLKNARTVFFQNPDDRDLFLKLGMVCAGQAQSLPGSGVDLERFSPCPVIERDGAVPFRFLLIARMLWDKGIGEYVEAARKLKAEGRNVECELLGFLGSDNPTAIPPETISAWEREGLVRHLGATEDVRPHLAEADCVVLPSYYREGTPRSLLEAAATARPIVTTDAVGCREAVDDGETGFLCRPRDADDLADKMRQMMDLPWAARAQLGQMGREKMVRQFDEGIVIDRYLHAIRSLVGTP
jgi:glycosyltransferase involved in cell wall biosynthesis